MPTPEPTETRTEFIDRCIPIVIDDGTAQDGGQAFAVCDSMFTESRKETNMTMERKTFDATIIDTDDDKGLVTAIFAVTGNIDYGNDRIKSGAFVKTITESGLQVAVLDQHRTDSTEAAIARTVSLREIGKSELPPETIKTYPDATGGVKIVAQFLLEDPLSKAIFLRLKEKLVNQWSFGYDALVTEFTEEKKDGKNIVVRDIKEIKLYEVSPVLFGMNSATSTTDAKAADDTEPEEKADGVGHWVQDGDTMHWVDEKAGRAISARNEAQMRAIIDNVQAQLTRLESILPSAPEPEMEQEPEEGEEKADGEILGKAFQQIAIEFTGVDKMRELLLKSLEGWSNVDALRQAVIEEYKTETTQPNPPQAGPDGSPPTIEAVELIDIDSLLKQK